MKRWFLSLWLFAVLCGVASAAEHLNIAGRDVAIWKPAGAAPATGYPVVLFSHGFGGCNTQSVFLMEALSQAGYLVLAPNHKDAGCGTAKKDNQGWYPGKAFSYGHPEKPFRHPEAWSDSTYKDRLADMKAVLDEVLRGNTFQSLKIDAQRVGAAGHSLGGYTVLGLAGAWPSWKDGRIKAVLALSPYCEPYISKGDLAHMNVPVMYQGGTRDIGVTPVVKRANGAYDRSSVPKYYVEFDGAGHFAWTNANKQFQPTITTYSVAFFDQYLKGNATTKLSALFGGSRPNDVSMAKFVQN
jgi:predicted dienelactone hydrolase